MANRPANNSNNTKLLRSIIVTGDSGLADTRGCYISEKPPTTATTTNTTTTSDHTVADYYTD